MGQCSSNSRQPKMVATGMDQELSTAINCPTAVGRLSGNTLKSKRQAFPSLRDSASTHILEDIDPSCSTTCKGAATNEDLNYLLGNLHLIESDDDGESTTSSCVPGPLKQPLAKPTRGSDSAPPSRPVQPNAQSKQLQVPPSPSIGQEITATLPVTTKSLTQIRKERVISAVPRTNIQISATARSSIQIHQVFSPAKEGKDSSWHALSCTSANSAMYSSYENSFGQGKLSEVEVLMMRTEDSHSGSWNNSKAWSSATLDRMHMSRFEKEALGNMHGFCFTESEEENEDEDEDNIGQNLDVYNETNTEHPIQ